MEAARCVHIIRSLIREPSPRAVGSVTPCGVRREHGQTKLRRTVTNLICDRIRAGPKYRYIRFLEVFSFEI